MPESLSLTLLAISTTIIALCVLTGTLMLVLIGRRLMDLTRRVQELTEQLRAIAVPTAADVRATVRSVSQLAAVGARLARPMVMSTMLPGPRWLRSLAVAAGLYSSLKEVLPSFKTFKKRPASTSENPTSQPTTKQATGN